MSVMQFCRTKSWHEHHQLASMVTRCGYQRPPRRVRRRPCDAGCVLRVRWCLRRALHALRLRHARSITAMTGRCRPLVARVPHTTAQPVHGGCRLQVHASLHLDMHQHSGAWYMVHSQSDTKMSDSSAHTSTPFPVTDGSRLNEKP